VDSDAGAATPLAIGVTAAVAVMVGAVAMAIVPGMGSDGRRPAALTTAPYPTVPPPTYVEPTYVEPTYVEPTYAEPTETATPGAVPPGYQAAQGAEGLTVAVPGGWTAEPIKNSTNVQVVDPAGDCLLRFGGSVADTSTVMEAVDVQVASLSSRPQYQKIQQQAVDYGYADDAVDWEFTFRADTGPRHAYGRYWRVGGIDYVVYGSCSTAAWPSFGDALDTAFATANPH
jgi:hypothetical protein